MPHGLCVTLVKSVAPLKPSSPAKEHNPQLNERESHTGQKWVTQINSCELGGEAEQRFEWEAEQCPWMSTFLPEAHSESERAPASPTKVPLYTWFKSSLTSTEELYWKEQIARYKRLCFVRKPLQLQEVVKAPAAPQGNTSNHSPLLPSQIPERKDNRVFHLH